LVLLRKKKYKNYLALETAWDVEQDAMQLLMHVLTTVALNICAGYGVMTNMKPACHIVHVNNNLL
jgi:hypothetical protein